MSRVGKKTKCDDDEIQVLVERLVNIGSGESVDYARLTECGEVAVEPLIEVLQQATKTWARAGAARVLGDIHDERALQPLVKALEDPDDPVWEMAKFALYRFAEKARPYFQQIQRDNPQLFSKIFTRIKVDELIEQNGFYRDRIDTLGSVFRSICPVCGNSELGYFWTSWFIKGLKRGSIICPKCSIEIEYYIR